MIENRTGGAHQTGLRIAGLPAGQFAVTVDGKTVATISGGTAVQTVALPIGANPTGEVTISRRYKDT